MLFTILLLLTNQASFHFLDTFYLAVLLVDLMVMLKLSRHEHMKKVDQQS